MKDKVSNSVLSSIIFSKIMLAVVVLIFSNFNKSFAQSGAALNFDGIDDFVQVNDNALLDFEAGDFTIEYWVNKKNTNVYGGVSKWNTGSTPTTNEWGLLLNADGAGSNKPNFIIESGATTYACPATTDLNLNTWYHIAGVKEGTNLKIYVNGILENTVTIGNVWVNNAGRDLLIDKLFAGYYGGADYDEVRIWHVARTITEINLNKNCELQGNEDFLVAYFKFNQGINNANNSLETNLLNTTTNNLPGTLNNFTLNGTTSNWVAGGAVITGNSCVNKAITNGGSGLAVSYLTLNDALSALNATTITSPVIITLIGNETAPAGGYQITAQGTAVNTITIQGNTSTITASNAHIVGSRTDAIFKLIGADYITLQNFTMQENAANLVNTLASNTRTEFGVGLFYASTTNGSQNNTIQNNTISLNRLYQNSFGIYSNTNHTFTNGNTTANITALSGANSNNKFYSNTINNVNSGVTLIGSGVQAYMDENNEIGGNTTVSGNSITNWGSNTATDASLIGSLANNIQGIYVNHQKGYTIANNGITSATAISANSLRGIFQNYSSIDPIGTFTNNINNNQITLNAQTIIFFEHILLLGGVSTGILNVTNNTMLNSVISGVNSSITMHGISNSSSFGIHNINNNTIKGWTSTATSGGFNGFIQSSGNYSTINFNNNKIGENTTPAITFSVATSGGIIGIGNFIGSTNGTINISNNDFRGLIQNNLGSGAHTYIQNNVQVANLNVSDNTFTNITANTTGAITFINHSYTIPANGTQIFNNNRIVTNYSKTGSGGNIIIFSSNGNSPNGTTTTYTNNNFSNISAIGTSAITGISNANGTTTSGSNRIVTGNTFSNWISSGGTIVGILFSHIGANSTISNNIFSNFTSSGAITSINISSIYSGGNPLNINNNTITQLTTGLAIVTGLLILNNSPIINVLDNTISEIKGAGAFIRGISITGGVNRTINRNKISNLEGTASNSIVAGINLLSSTNSLFDIKNNYIGNLTNTIANNTGIAITGINMGNVAANCFINVHNNTIYLNASSTGANFSTAALYHTTNTTATISLLDMQNNIFTNNSVAKGTGRTVAYSRTAPTLNNFTSTSNNNNFVAPFIFSDGTNFDTSIEAYKTRVAPRETNSISETVNFLSTNPIDITYLHINPAIPTALESRALPIASVVTDFDSDIRQGQPGYTGTGTAPDIGADEFEGIACSTKPIVVSTITYNLNATAILLTATGTNLLWYTTATGGTGTVIAPTPSTTTVGTTSYWVTQGNINGCESARVKIDVIVDVFASHLNFNATTDYVNAGAAMSAALTITNKFTVEAWVYPTAVSNGLGNDFGMIVGNYNTSVNSMQFMLRKESGTDYAFWVNTGSGYQAVGAVNSLTLNTWQHIAGVWNGSDIKIYINGVLINTTTGVTGTNFASISNPIRMGLNNSNEKFVGNIDEVRIWTRALTQAEIQRNMNCELPAGQTNLLAYYKFNQGYDAANNATVTTLTDSSGNNYNGTLTGFALNGTTSNWLGGSIISSGITIPNAPSAVAQTFCNATVSNLIPASSASIIWYNVASGGSALLPTDILTTGTYYISAVNANGCESTRTAVAITVAETTEWNGAWTNGLPISGKKVIISADYSGVGFTACALDVTGTAIVVIPSNETLFIDGIVNVAPTASLTFSNNANLVQNLNITNIGNITSLRDSSPVIRLDYVAWSSPVLNQNVLNFSPTTLTNRFYRYEPSGTTTATSWIAIDPTTTNFSPALGNLIRTPNTWSPSNYSAYSGNFTGIPNNGNYTPAVTLGYNLLGNPYPSPISGTTFIGNNTSIGATTLYFWAHVIPASAGTYAQNNYASYTTAGGVAAAAGGSQPNGTIQVGQGFFTNVTTAGNAVFNNAQRVASSTGQFFRTNNTDEKHRLWLDLTSPNNLHNQMMVAYFDGATNTIDQSDGKLFGNTNSVIYNTLENDKYVIQGKALPFAATDVVSVGFMAANAGEFTIALSQFDGLFATQDIYLKDKLLNLTHNLKNTAYTFTSNEGEFNNRFEIVYSPLLLHNPTVEFNTNSVIVYKNNTSLEINSGYSILSEITIFDMRGRKISSKSNINANVTRFENLNIQQEVVFVEVIDSNGNKVTKKMVF